MKFLTAVYEEIAGMFVDDGNLALLSLALVIIVALLTKLTPLPLLWAGLLLLVGCLSVLTESVMRAVRQKR
jgi:hypothetical protein